MFEEQRTKLVEWLTYQTADWEESGESSAAFAERILTHVWWVLEPAVDDRLAEEREATWAQARDGDSGD